MAQLIKSKLVFFKSTPNNDRLDPSRLGECIFFDVPYFYLWEHGEAMPPVVSMMDRSLTDPYFKIAEEHLEEDEFLKNQNPKDDLPKIGDAITSDDIILLSDDDIDWDEYELLDKQFDLEDLSRSDGLVIVCLVKSIFVLAPLNTPEENEHEMLNGFDLSASNIPKVPIHCQLSWPS